MSLYFLFKEKIEGFSGHHPLVKARDRHVWRAELDSRLKSVRELSDLEMPSGGWIRSVREALGMGLEVFARRLGLASPSAVHKLESHEVEETITLRKLRSAADALGCDLVVTFVPRVPLEQMVARQAEIKAVERVARLGHSMDLERQSIPDAEVAQMVRETTAAIRYRGGSALWE